MGMNKIMTITVIALVAVIMGMSAIAPMIQYAEARHGERLTTEACNALTSIPNPPPQVKQIIKDHCDATVPPV